MDNPDWAKILTMMYEESPEVPTTTISEDHPFVRGTDLDVEAATGATSNLERWGLLDTEVTHVSMDNPSHERVPEEWGYHLSNDGFNVAHEREQSRQRNRINHALVFLTFVLVLAQIIGVIPMNDASKVLSGFVIMVGMLYVVSRTDMLGR